MKKAIAQYIIAGFLIFFNTSTPPRVESASQGTVVLVDVLENEVVFSADSRVTTDNGSYMDNDCKLATFNNDAIFTASGRRQQLLDIVGGKPRLWNSHTVAQEAIKIGRLERGKETLAFTAAHYWSARTTSLFQAIVDAHPTYFPRYIDIVDGAFASRDEAGNLSVYSIAIQAENDRLDPTKARLVPSISLIEISDIFGDPPIIEEFLHDGQSARAKNAIARWQSNLPRPISDLEYDERFDVQLIQWAIDFSNKPLIGGDVNAVVLDKKGIRWLAQKDYCRAAN